MNILLIPIFLPIVIGIIIFILRKFEYMLSLITTVTLFILSVSLFYFGEKTYEIFWLPVYGLNFTL